MISVNLHKYAPYLSEELVKQVQNNANAVWKTIPAVRCTHEMIGRSKFCVLMSPRCRTYVLVYYKLIQRRLERKCLALYFNYRNRNTDILLI